jgi:hypothetical protein
MFHLGKRASFLLSVFQILSLISSFRKLVPEGVNGIILVIENTCNQTRSYQIDGPEIT